MEDLIICVAPYPGEKQEEKFPGHMDISNEAIRSYNAGASIVHLHVRAPNGLQTIDTQWFKQDIEKIKATCPIIIEGSTGGAPEHTLKDRCVSFTVPGIEMGSLNLGSINMYDGVYNNSIGDIIYYATALKTHGIKPMIIGFDLSHFYRVEPLVKEGLLSPPYTFALVFDVPNTLPYSERNLDLFLSEIPNDSVWFLARHHAKGAGDFKRAIETGGHVRVGYEDGPFLSDGSRASSNADLVEDIVNYAKRVGRKIANPEKARKLMGLH